MLAVTYHRSRSKGMPWDRRMSDVPEATARANKMLAQRVCPSTVLSHLEAYGYSFYVALAAMANARAMPHPPPDRS